MRTRSRWLFLILYFATCAAMATERTWVYVHSVVKDEQNQQVAELSDIASINIEPIQQRLLVKIGDQLLVVRYTLGNPNPMNTSYQLVSTGETLSINDPSGSTATMSLGSQSFSFQESDNGGNVRAQAAALIATGSTTFQDTLKQFTTIGLNTYKPFYPQAKALREMFFPNLGIAASRNGKAQVSSKVSIFNPNSTAPSAFDSAFGSAYYQ